MDLSLLSIFESSFSQETLVTVSHVSSFKFTSSSIVFVEKSELLMPANHASIHTPLSQRELIESKRLVDDCLSGVSYGRWASSGYSTYYLTVAILPAANKDLPISLLLSPTTFYRHASSVNRLMVEFYLLLVLTF